MAREEEKRDASLASRLDGLTGDLKARDAKIADLEKELAEAKAALGAARAAALTSEAVTIDGLTEADAQLRVTCAIPTSIGTTQVRAGDVVTTGDKARAKELQIALGTAGQVHQTDANTLAELRELGLLRR